MMMENSGYFFAFVIYFSFDDMCMYVWKLSDAFFMTFLKFTKRTGQGPSRVASIWCAGRDGTLNCPRSHTHE